MSRRLLLAALISVALATTVVDDWSQLPTTDLDEIDELVFESTKTAARIHGPKVDALRCEGKHCSHVSLPPHAICRRNRASKRGEIPRWECEASFYGGYKLYGAQVNCDFIPRAGSSTTVLKDSCRLVFGLRHPDPAVEGHEEYDSSAKECPIQRCTAVNCSLWMFLASMAAMILMGQAMFWFVLRPRMQGKRTDHRQ